MLADAGVEVGGPCLSREQALADNPAFFHRARTARPHVAAKLAMSLDARIAVLEGERSRITGKAAHAEVHRIRAYHDAIMVGARTAEVDNPLLTARGDVQPGTPPIRIVLDVDARLALSSRLVETVEEAPVWVFCGEGVDETRLEELERAGVSVHPVPSEDGALDLRAVVSVAADLGVTSILCEGGGRTVDGLMEAGLIDRLYLFVAPVVVGDVGVPAFPRSWTGSGAPVGGRAGHGWRPITSPSRFGDDILAIWDRF